MKKQDKTTNNKINKNSSESTWNYYWYFDESGQPKIGKIRNKPVLNKE